MKFDIIVHDQHINKTMPKRTLIPALLTLTLLAACGGGGGGGGGGGSVDQSSAIGGSTEIKGPQNAEGYWSGTAATGTSFHLAILENGESWGIYTSTQGTFVSGALQGQTQTDGAEMTGSGRSYSFTTEGFSTGTLKAQVKPQSTLVTNSLAGFSATLTYNAGYDARATLSDLTGRYLIFGRSDRDIIIPNHVDINMQGVFSNLENGCTRVGQLTPRASGKNIFNMTVTFSGACTSFANGTRLQGIAFLDKSVTPYRLRSLSLNAERSSGMVIIGTKQ
jgi:hypothetical protein